MIIGIGGTSICKFCSCPSSFDPNSITGLTLWLDASDTATITKDGSNVVSQWNDKSVTGRNMSQGTAIFRPTYTANVLNSKAGITFDGINDYLTSSTTTNITNCSIFTVMKFVADDGSQDAPIAIGRGGTPLLGMRGLYRDPSNDFVWFLNWGQSQTSALNWDTGNYHVFGAVQSGRSLRILRDASVNSYTLPSTPANDTVNIWVVGAADFASTISAFSNAVICEILFYSNALSTDNENKVKTYLKAKWATP
jgi:hypothetical protein